MCNPNLFHSQMCVYSVETLTSCVVGVVGAVVVSVLSGDCSLIGVWLVAGEYTQYIFFPKMFFVL